MHTYVDLLRPRLLTQLTTTARKKRLLHSSNASDCGGGSSVFGSSDCTVQIIMATQFVKWWKTKFHTSTTCGYKNISVLGSDTSDGRPSDTEDLVKDDSSSSNLHGAHVNPGLAASSASSIHSHDHHLDYKPNEVKFEDFECDVHVEGSESGEERKEFSFTFYDLDGHGKITKDDIAGLVRSIYGAVNEVCNHSITVPQCGKKTIKVKLTVTPEKQIDPADKQSSQNNVNNNNNNNNQQNINNNNNTTNNLSGSPPTTTTTLTAGNNKNTPSSRPNNVNVTICQESQQIPHRERRRPKFNSVRLPNHLSSCRGCHMAPEVFRDCSASPMRNRKKWRERACSVQRPDRSNDLFELLQANMEKNNVSPCCRQPHHHNSPSPPFCSHNHLIDPTCPVLPLLNSNHNSTSNNNSSNNTNNNNNNNSENLLLQQCNNNNGSSNNGKLKLPLDHMVCSARNKIYDSSSQHHHPHIGRGGGHHNHQCKKHGHHRSRSHDLGQNLFKYHLLSERDRELLATPPNPNQQQCNNNHSCINHLNHHHEETLELLGGCIFNHHSKNSNILFNNVLPPTTTPSPHQLKHRNREQEHARAMAQVISWLERENIGMEKKFSSSSPKKIPATPPPVKRHEHHHIHEHHHYHHYHTKETPIIV